MLRPGCGLGRLLCVHAAFHDGMLQHPSPPDAGEARPEGLVGRAIFGQVTGRRGADGFPIRLTGWVDRIPAWLTVLVGHDNRSRDGRPVTLTGLRGGQAIFLDTGAGKGGALAWQDFSLAEAGLDAPQGPRPVRDGLMTVSEARPGAAEVAWTRTPNRRASAEGVAPIAEATADLAAPRRRAHRPVA